MEKEREREYGMPIGRNIRLNWNTLAKPLKHQYLWRTSKGPQFPRKTSFHEYKDFKHQVRDGLQDQNAFPSPRIRRKMIDFIVNCISSRPNSHQSAQVEMKTTINSDGFAVHQKFASSNWMNVKSMSPCGGREEAIQNRKVRWLIWNQWSIVQQVWRRGMVMNPGEMNDMAWDLPLFE
jgi:hypothetical protein